MRHRLQVSIPPELDAQLQQAAERRHMAKADWIRLVLQDAVKRSSQRATGEDPLALPASVNSLADDLEEMLARIADGRVKVN